MYISFYIKQLLMRYEQVEQDSCADPGFFVRRRGGGGGVEARRPENSLDNVFLVINLFQLILQFTEWTQWFYYRGEEGVQLLPGAGGVQRNPYNL